MLTFEFPNPQSGCFRFLPSQVTICPGSQEKHFLETIIRKRSSRWQIELPDRWYRLSDQFLIDGEFFNILISFSSGIIERLSVSIANQNVSSSWSSWSEKKELEKNTRHMEVLNRYYGPPPYAFFWGEIWSDYDPRSGSSSIGIRYK